MKIETTITVLEQGVCIIECDVTANIDYKIDRRHGELEWWVDQYTVEGEHRIWDMHGVSHGTQKVCVVIPDKLAEVFDEYLDREKIGEQVREHLADIDDDRADYLRDMAMDR